MIVHKNTKYRIARHLSRQRGLSIEEIEDFFFVVDAVESAEPESCRKVIGALDELAGGSDARGVLKRIDSVDLTDPASETMRFVANFVRKVAERVPLAAAVG
jgi:GTP cyclohydrolase FolE2